MISHGIVILYVYWIHSLNVQTLVNFSWFIHYNCRVHGSWNFKCVFSMPWNLVCTVTVYPSAILQFLSVNMLFVTDHA